MRWHYKNNEMSIGEYTQERETFGSAAQVCIYNIYIYRMCFALYVFKHLKHEKKKKWFYINKDAEREFQRGSLDV